MSRIEEKPVTAFPMRVFGIVFQKFAVENVNKISFAFSTIDADSMRMLSAALFINALSFIRLGIFIFICC